MYQLQFLNKLGDLLLTPDEEEPMEEEEESDSERDAGDDMRMDGLHMLQDITML